MLLILCAGNLKAQVIVKARVLDETNLLPVEGATVSIPLNNYSVITDVNGGFAFKGNFDTAAKVLVNCVGFNEKAVSISALGNNETILLKSKQVLLSDVLVSTHSANPYKSISTADIAMRGVSNSQEVLQIVPGLIIGQHQGGGKAEQIFLRGFDADHGTDVRLEADGMPVNMVSHAHGQGYADGHFIIPETIEAVNFNKGPYAANVGDFATAGNVSYQTKNYLDRNMLTAEAGMFNTYRFAGLMNLLDEKSREKQQSWYAAAEYGFSDGYFENSQHFKRVNVFTKYTGKLASNTMLSLSGGTFFSSWDASGQIPVRAVEAKVIGFFGAIDPNEGGETRRSNINLQTVTSFNNGNVFKNQLFYSNAGFDLFSNFSFFLIDTANGDQIRQRENRHMIGYNGNYRRTSFLGKSKLLSEAGMQVRADLINGSELSHTKDRITLLTPIKLGNIRQTSVSLFLDETLAFGKRFTMKAGLRFDQFYFAYKNRLPGDSTLNGIGLFKAQKNVVSPKINFYYSVDNTTQIYVSAGKGFHSNDARAVVAEQGTGSLPAVYGADIGWVKKPLKNLVMQAAVWYSYLQQEFVYSGDGGFVEFSGQTRRYGLDFSARYQPINSLYLDADLNYAHARVAGASKGQNYVPLAPVWSGSGGLAYRAKNGLNASARYRFISSRPANEDKSIKADGYFIMDATAGFTTSKFSISLVINNLANTKWKETQFNTTTRLKNERSAVEEICFTPGTPFATRVAFSYYFK